MGRGWQRRETEKRDRESATNTRAHTKAKRPFVKPRSWASFTSRLGTVKDSHTCDFTSNQKSSKSTNENPSFRPSNQRNGFLARWRAGSQVTRNSSFILISRTGNLFFLLFSRRRTKIEKAFLRRQRKELPRTGSRGIRVEMGDRIRRVAVESNGWIRIVHC